MQAVRVLGVDPGTRVVGWALLERLPGERPRRLDSGALRLGSSQIALPDRLLRMRQELCRLCTIWSPDLLAMEAAFFGKNASSALRLGEARGAVLVTAKEAGLAICEMPPALIKRRVAGAGAATKEQVARLVKVQLELDMNFASSDESDAVAVALCALIEADQAVRTQTASGQTRAARPRRLPKGVSEQ